MGLKSGQRVTAAWGLRPLPRRAGLGALSLAGRSEPVSRELPNRLRAAEHLAREISWKHPDPASDCGNGKGPRGRMHLRLQAGAATRSLRGWSPKILGKRSLGKSSFNHGAQSRLVTVAIRCELALPPSLPHRTGPGRSRHQVTELMQYLGP